MSYDPDYDTPVLDVHSFQVEKRINEQRLLYFDRFADAFLRKRIKKRIVKIFDEWRKFSFRYIYLRRQLLKSYILQFLQRRLHGWYIVTRRESTLRRCIKRYWRTHRNRRFLLWKHDTMWQIRKEKLYRFLMRHLYLHMMYQRRLRTRWAHLTSSFHRIVSALVIQRSQRSHRNRLLFWANKVVKRFFLRLFGLRIVAERRRNEMYRYIYETETADALVEKALVYLKNLLEQDLGKELHGLYMKAIKMILRKSDDDINVTPMFPSKLEMPGIASMWTTNGKAMLILKHRCEVEVRSLSLKKFRLVTPPLYECKKCHDVFLLRCEAHNHISRCCFNEADEIPQYLGWRLAEPVVEGALAPLVEHYEKHVSKTRKAHLIANAKYVLSLKSQMHYTTRPEFLGGSSAPVGTDVNTILFPSRPLYYVRSSYKKHLDSLPPKITAPVMFNTQSNLTAFGQHRKSIHTSKALNSRPQYRARKKNVLLEASNAKLAPVASNEIRKKGAMSYKKSKAVAADVYDEDKAMSEDSVRSVDDDLHLGRLERVQQVSNGIITENSVRLLSEKREPRRTPEYIPAPTRTFEPLDEAPQHYVEEDETEDDWY